MVEETEALQKMKTLFNKTLEEPESIPDVIDEIVDYILENPELIKAELKEWDLVNELGVDRSKLKNSGNYYHYNRLVEGTMAVILEQNVKDKNTALELAKKFPYWYNKIKDLARDYYRDVIPSEESFSLIMPFDEKELEEVINYHKENYDNWTSEEIIDPYIRRNSETVQEYFELREKYRGYYRDSRNNRFYKHEGGWGVTIEHVMKWNASTIEDFVYLFNHNESGKEPYVRKYDIVDQMINLNLDNIEDKVGFLKERFKLLATLNFRDEKSLSKVDFHQISGRFGSFIITASKNNDSESLKIASDLIDNLASDQNLKNVDLHSFTGVTNFLKYDGEEIVDSIKDKVIDLQNKTLAALEDLRGSDSLHYIIESINYPTILDDSKAEFYSRVIKNGHVLKTNTKDKKRVLDFVKNNLTLEHLHLDDNDVASAIVDVLVSIQEELKEENLKTIENKNNLYDEYDIRKAKEKINEGEKDLLEFFDLLVTVNPDISPKVFSLIDAQLQQFYTENAVAKREKASVKVIEHTMEQSLRRGIFRGLRVREKRLEDVSDFEETLFQFFFKNLDISANINITLEQLERFNRINPENYDKLCKKLGELANQPNVNVERLINLVTNNIVSSFEMGDAIPALEKIYAAHPESAQLIWEKLDNIKQEVLIAENKTEIKPKFAELKLKLLTNLFENKPEYITKWLEINFVESSSMLQYFVINNKDFNTQVLDIVDAKLKTKPSFIADLEEIKQNAIAGIYETVLMNDASQVDKIYNVIGQQNASERTVSLNKKIIRLRPEYTKGVYEKFSDLQGKGTKEAQLLKLDCLFALGNTQENFVESILKTKDEISKLNRRNRDYDYDDQDDQNNYHNNRRERANNQATELTNLDKYNLLSTDQKDNVTKVLGSKYLSIEEKDYILNLGIGEIASFDLKNYSKVKKSLLDKEFIYRDKYKKADYVDKKALFEDVKEWMVPVAISCSILYKNNSHIQYFQKIEAFNSKLDKLKELMPEIRTKVEKKLEDQGAVIELIEIEIEKVINKMQQENNEREQRYLSIQLHELTAEHRIEQGRLNNIKAYVDYEKINPIDVHDSTLWMPQALKSKDREALKTFIDKNLGASNNLGQPFIRLAMPRYDDEREEVIYQDEISIIAAKWDSIKSETRKRKYDDVYKEASAMSFENIVSQDFQDIAKKYIGSQNDFEEAQRIFINGANTPSRFKKEPIYLDDMRVKIADKDDPRVLFAGKYTSCCQSFDDVGSDCAIDSVLNPDSGALLFESKTKLKDDNDNEIWDMVGVSWFYQSEKNGYNNLTFDNVEVNNYCNKNKEVKDLFDKMVAEFAKDNYKIITMGAGRNDISTSDYKKADDGNPAPYGYTGYTDAGEEQFLLHNNKKATPEKINPITIEGIVPERNYRSLYKVAEKCFPKGDIDVQISESLFEMGMVLKDREKDDQIVGYVVWDDDKRHIEDMAVLPEYRTDENSSSKKLLDNFSQHILKKGGEWRGEFRDKTSLVYMYTQALRGAIKVKEFDTVADRSVDSDGTNYFKLKFEPVHLEDRFRVAKENEAVAAEMKEKVGNGRQKENKKNMSHEMMKARAGRND